MSPLTKLTPAQCSIIGITTDQIAILDQIGFTTYGFVSEDFNYIELRGAIEHNEYGMLICFGQKDSCISEDNFAITSKTTSITIEYYFTPEFWTSMSKRVKKQHGPRYANVILSYMQDNMLSFDNKMIFRLLMKLYSIHNAEKSARMTKLINSVRNLCPGIDFTTPKVFKACSRDELRIARDAHNRY
jgi:hypothetical protein